MTVEIEENPAPGWYAVIEGHQFDLDDWCIRLRPPFDPAAIRVVGGRTLLASGDFADLKDESEVRERAAILIGILNGALRLFDGVHAVQIGGVSQVSKTGEISTILHAHGEARVRVRAVADAEVIGKDGEPKPQPPPPKSEPQLWNELAQANDWISEMLDHFGRANNWYDIYKTIEFCGLAVGGKHKLWKLLGDRGKPVEDMATSANFYRHAKAHRPAHLHTLGEAQSLLAEAVRATLAKVTAAGP